MKYLRDLFAKRLIYKALLFAVCPNLSGKYVWNHDCDFKGTQAAVYNPNRTGVLAVPRSAQLDARVARGDILTVTQDGCDAVYFQGMLGTFTAIDLADGPKQFAWDDLGLRYSEKFQFYTHGGACRGEPVVVSNGFNAQWIVAADADGLSLQVREAVSKTPLLPLPLLGGDSHQFSLSCRLERVR